MLRGAAVLAALLAALRPAAVLTTAAVLTSVSAAWACPGEQTVPAVPHGDLTYWSAFQQRLAAGQADKAEVRNPRAVRVPHRVASVPLCRLSMVIFFWAGAPTQGFEIAFYSELHPRALAGHFAKHSLEAG